MKILTTGDIHIGNKIDLEEFESKSIDYVVRSVEETAANYFIINGDTTHKAGIKGDSKEFQTTFNFLAGINKPLYELDCKIIVLLGTESHDGKNIKSIVELIKANGLDPEDNIAYIDSITYMKLCDGVNECTALFIPEPYYPSYDAFKNVVEGALNGDSAADVVIFHLMIDKAIPQYKAVNSQYGMNRSLVVDLRYIQNITNIVAFGSHFHAEKRWGNVHYINTFTNHLGQTESNGDIGLKLFSIDLQNRDYDYKSIPNPHTTLMYRVAVNIAGELPDVCLERTLSLVNETRERYKTSTDWIQIVLVGNNDIGDISVMNTVYKILTERGYNVKKNIKKNETLKNIKHTRINNTINDESIASITDDMIKHIFGKVIEIEQIKKHIFDKED